MELICGCVLIFVLLAIVWLVAAVAKPKRKASADSGLISELKVFGIKTKILAEITKAPRQGERVIGSLGLHFKQKVIFTTHRIISVCPLPGFGVSTEWEGMKIVLMGGNFQIPFSDLSGIARADSRIRSPMAVMAKPPRLLRR